MTQAMKSVLDVKGIISNALMDIRHAPLILTDDGVCKEAIVQKNSMVCKIRLSNTVRIDVYAMDEKIKVGMQYFHAEYSFENLEWNLLGALSSKDMEEIVEMPELNQTMNLAAYELESIGSTCLQELMK